MLFCRRGGGRSALGIWGRRVCRGGSRCRCLYRVWAGCWLVQGRKREDETYVDRAGLVFECVPVVELFFFNEDLFGVWFPDFP